MRQKTLSLTVSLLVGLGLTLTLALSSGQFTPVRADPDLLYVAPGADCNGLSPCYASVQAAVDAAVSGDEIRVAAGSYSGVSAREGVTQVVYINKTVTVRGGYTTDNWTAPDPDANPTTLDAQGQGRVVYLADNAAPTIEGLRITGGDASGLGGGYWDWDCGGGVYVDHGSTTVQLNNNQVFSNTAYLGGGVCLYYGAATLTGNQIFLNTAESGGGLWLDRTEGAVLAENAVLSNTATWAGGGAYFFFGSGTLLEGNVVASNVADSMGGGLYLDAHDAMLDGNWIRSNVVSVGGPDWWHGGGGLHLRVSDVALVNNMVVDNRVAGTGGGIKIRGGSVRMLHNTFARNTGEDGSGIQVLPKGEAGNLVLTNTVLVSHTVGITVAAGNTATLESSLWGSGAWSNETDWAGDGSIFTGTLNIWGDPHFVDPEVGDYHVRPPSAAIDAGVDAGVYTDIDGDARPQGSGFDIGADEFVPPIYVDHQADGGDDGSSWADAYTDLQDALRAAEAGDEVWVAQGVYYPAPDARDRTATFELQDGVALYGGFAGTETERDQRDWAANVTVLSGDLDRNDTADDSGVVLAPADIVGDNAYHVVTGDGVGEKTVLDGFTITAGKADGDYPFSNGGGMVNDNGSHPRLANVTFRGNYAQSRGGATSNVDSNPTLRNVTFSGNYAAGSGGAMDNAGSSPTLINVAFSGNYAERGGGVINQGSSPTLRNVTFTGNRAESYGGGIYNYASSPILTNVTFGGNHAGIAGGAMHSGWYSNPTLVNCILWANGPQEIDIGDNTSVTIAYSNVGLPTGVYPGTGNINQDPLFIDPVPEDKAPTTDGNYRLRIGSPAIDAGTNDVVTVNMDLDGNPRIVDGTGDGTAIVDMGAYEFQVHLEYTLDVTIIGEGEVDIDPEQDTYAYGDVVTLKPTPDPGWTFDAWSGPDADDLSDKSDGSWDLVIHSDKRVTATFIQDEYTLDVGIVGQGDVNVDPHQDTYHYGDVITLTATPDAGWSFDGWTGDLESTDNPLELMVEGDTVITATFKKMEYKRVYLPLVLANR